MNKLGLFFQLKRMLKWGINTFLYIQNTYFNSLVKSQLSDVKSIPILIINYNQLFYLKKLVQFLLDREFKTIVIIDNQSTYPPLLDYYREMDGKVTIERQKDNLGHMVVFKQKNLYSKYCQGYFVMTDADIVPNCNLPDDFLSQMIHVLKKYKTRISKVAFALDVNTIPDYYPLKEKVLNWEKRFWQNRVEENAYLASTDTTFAVYQPKFPMGRYKIDFFSSIRLAGDFTALHGGWYIDYDNLTDEQVFYRNTATSVSSWKLTEDGDVSESFKKIYG